jgi:succinate dehydrogenase / fumarate reductase, membrane anchor subunit
MTYLTDRKRAAGLGSAKSGTEHHWKMMVSSVALLGLIPLFLFTFGPMVGQPLDVVTAYYARPLPAIIAGLTFVVGALHFKAGIQVVIEDYAHGFLRKALLIGSICLSYTLAAAGLFAIARIAL